VFERIVIGVDESPESLVAVRQTARLLEPDGRLVVHGGCGRGARCARGMGGDASVGRHQERSSNGAQRAAKATADLLVVGSRGVHGMAALGSVSEQVAHRAGCSVLVIRENDARH
jgi:nucleotide-binding universal stress UspA family protein